MLHLVRRRGATIARTATPTHIGWHGTYACWWRLVHGVKFGHHHGPIAGRNFRFVDRHRQACGFGNAHQRVWECVRQWAGGRVRDRCGAWCRNWRGRSDRNWRGRNNRDLGGLGGSNRYGGRRQNDWCWCRQHWPGFGNRIWHFAQGWQENRQLGHNGVRYRRPHGCGFGAATRHQLPQGQQAAPQQGQQRERDEAVHRLGGRVGAVYPTPSVMEPKVERDYKDNGFASSADTPTRKSLHFIRESDSKNVHCVGLGGRNAAPNPTLDSFRLARQPRAPRGDRSPESVE